METIPQKLINFCQACDSPNLQLIYDFGEVALAGYFPFEHNKKLPLLEMKLIFCPNCKLIQTSPNISDDFLFDEYRYVSSIGMRDHFRDLAEWWFKSEKPNKSSKILEIGCNDGPLLFALSDLGFKPIGIDPAKNIVRRSKNSGLRIIEDYFNSSSIFKYSELQGLDYIFSSNSFAHISNIGEIAKSVANALNSNGKLILEVQSFPELVRNNTFDFVYHEHKYYYTVESLTNLFNKNGLFLTYGTTTASHGGSYRLVFSKKKSTLNLETKTFIQRENVVDMTVGGIRNSIDKFYREIDNLKFLLEKLSLDNQKITAFGASGRANMILSALGSHRNLIDCVLDESPERIGRQMAQFNLKIKPFSSFDCNKTDYLLILAWNYTEIIIEKWTNKNTKFIIPLPKFKVISNFS